MPEQIIKAQTYVLICGILIALTFLTLGVSFLDLSGQWHLIIGLTIAVCKAALVVLFFMEAFHSPKVTWIVIVVTIFWLLLFMSLTMSDYFTREMVPFMPGH